MVTLIFLACQPTLNPIRPGEESAALDSPPAPMLCEEPVEGFLRLQEEAAAHGINQLNGAWSTEFPGVTGGSVAAEDLDGDGDIDLTIGTAFFPAIYENDGKGMFSRLPIPEDIAPLSPVHALIDLDGDHLPEVVIPRPGELLVYKNLGNLSFGDVQTPWKVGLPYGVLSTAAFGDMDGDGDLDLVLPQIQLLTEECQIERSCTEEYPPIGAPTLLLRNNNGTFSQAAELVPESEPSASTAAIFTDRDADGDADLLIASERSFHTDGFDFPPTAFFRNDGLRGEEVRWVNDAPEIHADLVMSGMGVATTDLNEDGYLDYCITDTGPTRCLMADGVGAYYDATAVLNLRTQNSSDDVPWSAWSIEILDYDNDGNLDVATAAGQPLGAATTTNALYQDAIWQGTGPMAFTEMSDEVQFNSEQHNFGMAAADFDGDGYLELVINTSQGKPLYWQNHCGENTWLQLDLIGKAPNVYAYGARVEIQSGGRRYVQEVQNLRGLGQSPSRLHFGLGSQTEVETLRITWPDGEQTELNGVPTRQILRLEQ